MLAKPKAGKDGTTAASLRTAAQLDAVVEADESARRFAEKFEAITRELRDSLHREKVVLDECRQLCEAAMSQSRGLEVAMSHSLMDAGEMEALRSRLIDAERQAEEAKMREGNAKSAVAKKVDEISFLRGQLQDSAEQAARLRNVITAQAAKEKPKVALKKLGSGATPFEDWKAATGRVTLTSGDKDKAPTASSLGSEKLRRLGIMPAEDVDRVREGVRAAARAVAGLPPTPSASGSVSGLGAGLGAGGGEDALDALSTLSPAPSYATAGGRDRDRDREGGHAYAGPSAAAMPAGAASPLRIAARGVMGGGGGGSSSAAGTPAAGRGGGAAMTGAGTGAGASAAGPGLAHAHGAYPYLEIEPHPLFPAHLYLAPAPAAAESPVPLAVQLVARGDASMRVSPGRGGGGGGGGHGGGAGGGRGVPVAASGAATLSEFLRQQGEEDVDAGRIAIAGSVSDIDYGAGTGAGSAGSKAGRAGLLKEVDEQRSRVQRLMARIEARSGKLRMLRGDAKEGDEADEYLDDDALLGLHSGSLPHVH